MTEDPGSASQSGRSRRWPLVLLAAIFLLIVSLAVLLVYRAQIAGELATRWLRGIGIDAVLTVETIDLTGVRLRDVKIGEGGPSLEAAEINYTVSDLLEGRIGDLVLHGLELSGSVDQDGVQVRGVPTFSSDAPAQTVLPALPFSSATLEDFKIRIDTPASPLVASGDAVVRPRPGNALEFSTDVVARGDPGTIHLLASGRVTESRDGTVQLRSEIEGTAEVQQVATGFAGTVEATSDASGAASASLSLREGRIEHEAGSAGGLAGEIQVRLASGELESATADLRMTSGQLAATEIGQSGLRLTYGDGQLAAAVDFRWEGGSIQGEIAPAGDGDALPYALEAEGSLDAEWLSGLAEAWATTTGKIAFALAGRIVDPMDHTAQITPSALLQAGSLQGRIELDLGKTTVSQLGTAERLTGVLGLGLEKEELRVHTEEAISATSPDLAPSVLEGLPAPLREVAARARTVSIGSSGGSEITIRPAQGGAEIEAAIGAEVEGEDGAKLSVGSNFAAEVNSDFAVASAEAKRVALSGSKLKISGMTLGGTAVATDLRTSADGWRGALEIDLSASGRPTHDVRVQNARLQATGTFRLDGERVAFDPVDAGRLVIGGVEASGVRVTTPTTVTIRALKESEPLVFDFSRGLTANLRTGAIALRVTATEPTPLQLEIAARAVTLNAQSGKYELSLSGGSVGLPAHDLKVDGVAARANLTPPGGFSVRVDAAEVKHLEAIPLFIPLKLWINIQGSARQATFNAELFDPGRRLVLKARGRHSLARGRGQAQLELEPIVFIPTVLQLRELFPAAYQLRAELDARFAATAEADWGSGGLQSSGVLDAEITELSTNELEVKSAAATLRFDSLMPLSTEPSQLVTIGELNVGLPLTDGLIRLELHPDSRVTGVIEQFRLFGGWIRTEPIAIDPKAATTEVRLAVEGVDLAQFLAFAELGELEATGTLRGTLPVFIESGEVRIRDGMLESAEGGGILRYRPAGVATALEEANEATEVLMKALQDFRYSGVRVHIDETSAENMTLRLTLEGHSPDVYQGLPLQLNVNVEGPLKEILGRGLRTYQLPEELGRQLQDQIR